MGLKGFILTTDMLLAFGIASVILLAVSYTSSKSENLYPYFQLNRQTNDILKVLDYNQTSQTLDSLKIRQGLKSLLDTNLAAKLEIRVYENKNGDFVLNQSLVIIEPEGSVPSGDVQKGEKVFIIVDGGKTKFYSNATLWVWLK